MYCGFITIVALGIIVPSAQLQECQSSSVECYKYMNRVLAKIPDEWIESGAVTAYNQRCYLVPKPRPA